MTQITNMTFCDTNDDTKLSKNDTNIFEWHKTFQKWSKMTFCDTNDDTKLSKNDTKNILF